MRKFIDIVEGYEGAFNTRGKTCEVFRNPSSKEFRALGGEIRAFLVGNDVLMWSAYDALHQEVRDNLKLDRDLISLEIWSEGYGNDCLVVVTDNTERTSWFHNPEIRGEIIGHPGLRAMFDEITVEYFDEAIYGPWDEIRAEEDEGEEALQEELSDEELLKIAKAHRTYNRQERRTGGRAMYDREKEEQIEEDSGDHTPPENDPEDKAHYDALKQTGFFGAQAAGCIAMARTTGRILLVLRSEAVEQPFTWGNLGGAHHADEQPIHAAERELYEETGYTGRAGMVPLLVFTKGTFRYCNFLAIVDDEFVPSLGWEADDHRWVEYGNWPEPLHFGMRALFNDASSVRVVESYAHKFGENK